MIRRVNLISLLLVSLLLGAPVVSGWPLELTQRDRLPVDHPLCVLLEEEEGEAKGLGDLDPMLRVSGEAVAAPAEPRALCRSALGPTRQAIARAHRSRGPPARSVE